MGAHVACQNNSVQKTFVAHVAFVRFEFVGFVVGLMCLRRKKTYKCNFFFNNIIYNELYPVNTFYSYSNIFF